MTNQQITYFLVVVDLLSFLHRKNQLPTNVWWVRDQNCFNTYGNKQCARQQAWQLVA